MVEADYHTPYIVHATMEAVNATVHVRDDAIEVWGPIQGQDFVRNALARLFNRQPESVIVHTTFLGGSFGRKFLPDFVIHAARASAAVGQPVKVIRSREDDIRHGFYRPGVSGRFRAVLDAQGMPLAMHARVTGQSLYGVIKKERMAQNGGWDETMLEAIYGDLAYQVPNLKVDMIDAKQPIPVSFLRSVGSTSSVFMLELRQRDGRRGRRRSLPLPAQAAGAQSAGRARAGRGRGPRRLGQQAQARRDARLHLQPLHRTRRGLPDLCGDGGRTGADGQDVP